MSRISKPFVIATAGATIDGRVIKPEWINQMAANYDPKVYTAVANLEHILSLAPDSTFSATGQVLSLSTREADILGEKKLQLMAVVKADDAVVAMQAAGKKAFASMEIVENFAGKGFTYLTGLAFTDKPASLGTETMRFSANKQSVFSFGGDGAAIEWEDPAPESKAGESLFAKIKDFLSGKDKKTEDRFADHAAAVEAIAGSQRDLLDKYAALQADIAKAADAAAKANAAAEKTAADAAKVAADFTALSAKLDKEAGAEHRPPARGGNGGTALTDC